MPRQLRALGVQLCRPEADRCRRTFQRRQQRGNRHGGRPPYPRGRSCLAPVCCPRRSARRPTFGYRSPSSTLSRKTSRFRTVRAIRSSRGSVSSSPCGELGLLASPDVEGAGEVGAQIRPDGVPLPSRGAGTACGEQADTGTRVAGHADRTHRRLRETPPHPLRDPQGHADEPVAPGRDKIAPVRRPRIAPSQEVQVTPREFGQPHGQMGSARLALRAIDEGGTYRFFTYGVHGLGS